MHSDGLELFWGKARPVPDEGATDDPLMHPLIAHMLDVAAVAILLPGSGNCGLDRRQLGLLVALHDIGKLMPAFQAKVAKCWPEAVLGPFRGEHVQCPHDAAGLALLDLMVDGALAPLFGNGPGGKRWRPSLKLQLLRAIAGHHGQPVSAMDRGILEQGTIVRAQALVALLFDVFRPPPILRPGPDTLKRLEWMLAGITVHADWIGSRQEWFPYVNPKNVREPEGYFWNHALPRAQAAISRSGLGPMALAPFAGIVRLFDHIREPSPVQALLEAAALPSGPVLVVIEDMTGSGKTEAALVLAQRLMAQGRGSGLFVALPTMATANAMYDRLAMAYRRLFQPSARPSLALAHGRARLDERFVAALAPDDGPGGRSAVQTMDETAEAYCAAWLGSEARRALMAQVGVGTIDQALMAVLPVRFATVRQAGLAGKILIVDECHAFDPYMRREMVALLHFHAAMGGSAILLSATLTHRVRQELTDAFRKGLGVADPMRLSGMAYPLVTLVGRNGVEERPCAPRPGLARSIAARRLADADAATRAVTKAAAGGAAVAWIRNTVDEVIATARSLRAQGVEALVFHARFAMVDRLTIERDVLARFGKEGEAAGRSAVLVASQVIEQSLDLDFDVLCTDLAPMDQLIQRAGRLRRHRRTARPVDREELLVISPEPVADPDPRWIQRVLPGTASVYRDPALLWRTARVLFRHGRIESPAGLRALIEESGDASADAVPEGLMAGSMDAAGKALAAGAAADRNVLSFDAGYATDAALWEREARTPTRLEDLPCVTVRLAVMQDQTVLPWAAKADTSLARESERHRAWALSEVSVARYRLASCPPPVGLEVAVTAARAGWSRWEREAEDQVLLLVLRETEAGWRGAGRTETGHEIVIGYDQIYGLEIFRDQ
ncbi:CRISPR-associated helicase Cas3' [Gluconacetobacter azotocaptans]|uniref:CRISPR-associated helicase Cas3 n=2 Tax=Gluconacetobacter azotocaptans TaxID=142834 RepID=A0A7W4JQ28_9PROT|nr:CRISPR-associated helicase Cas3' [Gluconacetobacter azotocaptans]MBB2188675.1 CRISPR-associated helicase Cas3' [Gluconacetobacter azotocaptans]